MLGLIKEVNEWYSAMDVFVLPLMYEGLPVVTVEARANGLPICVSEAVPTEAVFNVNVMRLLLSTTDIWCRAIIDSVRLGRIVDNSTIKEAGFSIDREVKKLERWYLEKAKKLKIKTMKTNNRAKIVPPPGGYEYIETVYEQRACA